MYRKVTGYSTSSNTSPTRFIETVNDISDIANSSLLYKIDREKTRDFYTITKYEKRIDLISRDIYGSDKYSWLILYMNRISVNDLIRGSVITYIPQETLDEIINSI